MRLAVLVLALVFVPRTVGSQPLAMPDGPVGVGYFMDRSNRDFEMPDGSTSNSQWALSGLLVHGTLGHRILLMARGTYEPPFEDSKFPDREYQALGVGVGATAYPIISGPYRIGASARYYRNVWHDRSDERWDKVIDGLMLALQLERSFASKSLSALAWAAPAYHKHRQFEYPGLFPEIEVETDDNWGAILGTSVVLWKHVTPYVQLEFLERTQTLFGISYIF